MRPHTASAGSVSLRRAATATISSSPPSTPSCALTSAMASSSISAKVVTSSPERSASARSSNSSILAWFGSPVSLSASAARRASCSLAVSSSRARRNCHSENPAKPASTMATPATKGISRCIVHSIGWVLSQVRNPAIRPRASITGCISRPLAAGSLSNLRSFRPTLCSIMRTKRGSTASDLPNRVRNSAAALRKAARCSAHSRSSLCRASV